MKFIDKNLYWLNSLSITTAPISSAYMLDIENQYWWIMIFVGCFGHFLWKFNQFKSDNLRTVFQTTYAEYKLRPMSLWVFSFTVVIAEYGWAIMNLNIPVFLIGILHMLSEGWWFDHILHETGNNHD